MYKNTANEYVPRTECIRLRVSKNVEWYDNKMENEIIYGQFTMNEG